MLTEMRVRVKKPLARHLLRLLSADRGTHCGSAGPGRSRPALPRPALLKTSHAASFFARQGMHWRSSSLRHAVRAPEPARTPGEFAVPKCAVLRAAAGRPGPCSAPARTDHLAG